MTLLKAVEYLIRRREGRLSVPADPVLRRIFRAIEDSGRDPWKVLNMKKPRKE